MKKLLVMVLGLMVVVVAACGNNENDGTVSVEVQKNPLEDLIGKKSLTVEDLNIIDEYKFPKSYTYSLYNWDGWDSMLETWDYVYPDGVDHKLLLPIHENMANREVITSEMDNGRISTTVNITLNNGESYPVKYVNNPETLEYEWASLNTPTSTILYTFEY